MKRSFVYDIPTRAFVNCMHNIHVKVDYKCGM